MGTHDGVNARNRRLPTIVGLGCALALVAAAWGATLDGQGPGPVSVTCGVDDPRTQPVHDPGESDGPRIQPVHDPGGSDGPRIQPVSDPGGLVCLDLDEQ